MKGLILIASMLLASCASMKSEAAVSMGLNVLADTVGPASKLSHDVCVAREATLVAEEQAGKLTKGQADEQLGKVRATCDDQRAIFDGIRRVHDEAVALVEEGALEEARTRLDDARARFREIVGQAGVEP